MKVKMTDPKNVASKVNDILKSLKKKTVDEPFESVTVKPQVKKSADVPRGRPKSGRIWKSEKQRFSSIKKGKGAHNKFEEKQALRVKLKEMKEASREILSQKKAQKEANKERRRENIKKAEENRLKSEIVQVISNSAKVKRMKKKQLRFIEKRDTSKITKK